VDVSLLNAGVMANMSYISLFSVHNNNICQWKFCIHNSSSSSSRNEYYLGGIIALLIMLVLRQLAAW